MTSDFLTALVCTIYILVLIKLSGMDLDRILEHISINIKSGPIKN